MNKWTLKTQIAVLVAAVVVMAMSAIVYLTAGQIAAALHESLEQKCVSITAILAENIGPGLEFGDSAYVSDVVKGAFADDDVQALHILDADSKIIFSQVRDSRVAPYFHSFKDVNVIKLEHKNNQCIAWQPIVVHGAKVGVIGLAISRNTVSDKIFSSLSVIISGTVAILIIVILIGIFFSRKIVQPIGTFESAATRIASGDMEASIELSSLHPDFVPLGTAFNEMRAALEAAFEDLRNSRDNLEAVVTARTDDLQDELEERKKAEKALSEGQQLLQATIEATADGILVVDENNQITNANGRFAQLWNIPPDLLASRDDQKLIDYVLKQLKEPEQFVRKVQELYQSSDECLDTLYFKDDRVFERYSCPLIEEGVVTGRVWSFRDISSRMHAEEALRASEERYRLLIDNSGNPIMLLDIEGSILLINNTGAQLFGKSPEDITGRSIRDMFPEQVDTIMERIRHIVESGQGQEFEDEFTLPIGKRWFWSNLRPVLDSSGNVLGVQVVSHDITERKRAEEQERSYQEKMERAERMESLGVLAGGVAHDLNNMLGPLVGYPELILMKLPPDSPARKQIERMGNAAKDAAEVVQDLLTLARRGRYQMAPIDLNDVVRAYVDSPSFRGLADTHPEVSFELSLDPSMNRILGSVPHLSKVIMNLIVNAFDAMPEGGRFTIDSAQKKLSKLQSGFEKIIHGDYAVLRIRDTGIGIEPHDMDHIFEPYYSKKMMGASGSGLGLSVVYGVVKDHKGYYDILSTPGEGTEFIIYFPITNVATARQISAREELSGNETVLVVDDSPEQRLLAEELLLSLGYCVMTSVNGTEAVRFLRENSVDIVVLDMIMEQHFDGLDTYREMRKIHPDQKAIIVSGFSATDRVNKMQKLGAGEYLRKPYTRQALAKIVRSELDRVPTEESLLQIQT